MASGRSSRRISRDCAIQGRGVGVLGEQGADLGRTLRAQLAQLDRDLAQDRHLQLDGYREIGRVSGSPARCFRRPACRRSRSRTGPRRRPAPRPDDHALGALQDQANQRPVDRMQVAAR